MKTDLGLRTRLLLDVVIAVVICVIVSASLLAVLTKAMTEYGSRTENHAALAQKHIRLLQAYITKNQVESTNAKAFSDWNDQYRYVSILIRDEEKMCYNSFVAGNMDYDSWHGDTSYDWGSYVLPEYQAELQLADETAKLTIGGLFYQYYYPFIQLICLGVMFLTFGIAFFLLFRKYLRSIEAIRKRVDGVYHEKYEEDVHVDGPWELTQLAEQVNDMSHRIKASIDQDAEAAREKDAFVRAIAHDIRSPLAAVIGYLEILRGGKILEEDHGVYVEKALAKANRIRTLTDDFFLLNTQSAEPDLQEYDGNEVITSCIMDYFDFCQENGFQLKHDNRISEPFCVLLDRNLVQRILDNQYSNYLKYADPSQPIVLRTELTEGKLIIESRNRILPDAGMEDSHGIGLRICMAISERLGGDFQSERDGEEYVQTLRFPLQ